MRASEPKPLGIYIQVPFCQTKCTYCNFHTGVASPAAYAPYASAVEREIRDWRALHAAAGLESVNRLARGNATPTRCHSERSEQSVFGLNVASACPEDVERGFSQAPAAFA